MHFHSLQQPRNICFSSSGCLSLVCICISLMWVGFWFRQQRKLLKATEISSRAGKPGPERSRQKCTARAKNWPVKTSVPLPSPRGQLICAGAVSSPWMLVEAHGLCPYMWGAGTATAVSCRHWGGLLFPDPRSLPMWTWLSAADISPSTWEEAFLEEGNSSWKERFRFRMAREE